MNYRHYLSKVFMVEVEKYYQKHVFYPNFDAKTETTDFFVVDKMAQESSLDLATGVKNLFI